MWSVRVVRRLARVSHHYGARVQGSETDESATPATPQDRGAGTPRNRAVVRVAVLALVAALLAVAVGTAVMVASYWRAGAGRCTCAAVPADTADASA